MRRCLLRWQDERHSPTFQHRSKHLPAFSFTLVFCEGLQVFIHKGDTDLAYEISLGLSRCAAVFTLPVSPSDCIAFPSLPFWCIVCVSVAETSPGRLHC